MNRKIERTIERESRAQFNILEREREENEREAVVQYTHENEGALIYTFKH